MQYLLCLNNFENDELLNFKKWISSNYSNNLHLKSIKRIDLLATNQNSINRFSYGVMSGFICNKINLINMGADYYEDDCDFVAAGYKKFGSDFFNLLEGNFSIIIYDEIKKNIVIARDRVGTYPLFYYSDRGKIVISSNYKIILQNIEINKKVNKRAIGHYHNSGWLPRGFTFFENILSIPPGTVSVIDNNGLRVINDYQLLENTIISNDFNKNLTDVRSLLTEAVDLFKPYCEYENIGCTLSSGIDSSYFTAKMALKYKEVEKTLKTFTVGYGENDPEIIGARETSEYLKTDHHEVIVKPIDLLELWPEAIWAMEDPVGRDQYPCVVALAKYASNFVDQLYFANGPDSTYGGLDDHMWINNFNNNKYSKEDIQEYLNYLRSSTECNPENILYLRTKDENIPKPLVDLANEDKNNFNLPSDIYKYLVNEFKFNDGHLGMKHQLIREHGGLTARYPLYTHEILNLAGRIPDEHKIFQNTNKFIWRHAAAELLPKKICDRPKGIQHLEYGMEYSNFIDSLANKLLIAEEIDKFNILPRDSLSRLLRKNKNESYSSKHLYRIWYAISTHIWCKIFLENNGNKINGLEL